MTDFNLDTATLSHPLFEGGLDDLFVEEMWTMVLSKLDRHDRLFNFSCLEASHDR